MSVTVPFFDLTRSVRATREEILEAVAGVVDSGRYVLGEQGRRFEAEFAQEVGVTEAVGVASGTDAIEVALRALGVGAGDEVVTQASTCVPTVAAIERAGATPVLCDADADTGLIDVDSLIAVLGPHTRAVVPVHLYGQCCDLDALKQICEYHGLWLVEDCAQAHGASWRGSAAGSVGHAGCFSFYPTKNLGALGDAGAVVTSDPVLAERARRVRDYGQTRRYDHSGRGVNSRLDEMQAAILRVRLGGLPAGVKRRRQLAERYDAALAPTALRPLDIAEGVGHAYHLYVVRSDRREEVREQLRALGVETLVHYPRPVHGHEPYRELAGRTSLSGAERLAREVLSLPLYPELTDPELDHVLACVADVAVQA